MQNIIEVENLTKKYGNFVAVNDISFIGQKGEVIAFLGPNGAGKTTTMRIITCYMPATLGTARIDGFDIFEDSFKVRERIGYLPEVPPLYPDMTVQSFLKFVAEIKQVETNKINKRLEEVIEICSLNEMKSRLISKLSRGYKQRVGIAQAIIHDPKVIILDEPTVGLDPNQVIEIRQLIKNLAQDKTVLLSTHILSEAEALCKRVVIIDKGLIVAQGLWSELQEDLQEMEIIIIKIKNINDEKILKLKEIKTVKDIQTEDNQLIKLYCDRGSDCKSEIIKITANLNWDLDEIKTDKMALEDLFKRLTDKKKVQNK